jgi:hypothetical protein
MDIREEGINAQGLRRYDDQMRGFAARSIGLSFFSGKLLFGMKETADQGEVQE